MFESGNESSSVYIFNIQYAYCCLVFPWEDSSTRGRGAELPRETHRSAQAIHVPYLLEKELSSIRTALESTPHLRAKNTLRKRRTP